MKKTLIITAMLSMVGASVSNATTVTFGGVPTARTAVNTAGSTLTAGSLVWAGTFASEGFSLNSGVSLQSNVTAVTSAGSWKQFTLDPTTGLPDSGIVNNLTITGSGKAGGTVTDNNTPQADFFNSKPVYLWIFNATTVGAATEMGIFRATTATTPWTFPVNAGGIGDTVSLSSTPSGAPTVAAIGGFGSTPGSQFKLTDNFSVAPVPEPSTFAAGAMLALAAMGMRRRRA